MVTTAAMIKIGKVYQNLMVDLQVKNKKLLDRSIRIIVELTGFDRKSAKKILLKAKGNLKIAIIMATGKIDYKKASKILKKSNGMVKKALEKVGG
jgi:N-acetylmuramic acid 6-phosphate etherase